MIPHIPTKQEEELLEKIQKDVWKQALGEPTLTTNQWEIVYNELMQSGLCRGLFDNNVDSDSFMYGIYMVMEWIAEMAGKHDEFAGMFWDNFIACKRGG